MVSTIMLLNPFASVSTAAPGLTITASGTTTVGLQIFANSNLMGGASPTGSITFRLYGPGDTSCASPPIFTSTVPVSGTSMNSARYTTSTTGTYRWTSVYSGDANNSPVGPTSCSDADASVVVAGVYTAMSVTGPAPSGGTIHGAATLSGGMNPTGSLTFYLSGPGDTYCSQFIFTSTVAVNGNGIYNSGAYNPVATGTYRWRLGYSGDTNNKPNAVTACLDPNDSVNVTSLSQPPTVAVSPNNVSFAAQTVGSNSPAQTVTLTNTGGASLTVSGVVKSGSGAGDFAVGGDHCSGVTVAPNATCTLTVAFAPTAVGTRTATLVASDNAASSPQAVTLTGQATPDRGLLTYPLDRQKAVDTTRAFTWATAAPAQSYYLIIGTAQYGSNVLASGVLPSSQSAYNVPALPTGKPLYATLLTEIQGSWIYQAITFTAAPGLATFTNPTDGQTKVATNTVISWATIPQGQAYYLVVGTKPYGNDVVISGILPPTASSYRRVALPAGKTLYATLVTKTNGSWTRDQMISFTTS